MPKYARFCRFVIFLQKNGVGGTSLSYFGGVYFIKRFLLVFLGTKLSFMVFPCL